MRQPNDIAKSVVQDWQRVEANERDYSKLRRILGNQLTWELQTARNEALEEAAMVCESLKILSPTNPNGKQLNRTADQAAQAIRELKDD
jgi:Lon protease-like protein